MSSSLFRQLADLAAETRHQTETEGKFILEKLTVVIGYGHLVDTHPQLMPILEKHLRSFMNLTCSSGYAELCRHSGTILQSIEDGRAVEDAA